MQLLHVCWWDEFILESRKEQHWQPFNLLDRVLRVPDLVAQERHTTDHWEDVRDDFALANRNGCRMLGDGLSNAIGAIDGSSKTAIRTMLRNVFSIMSPENNSSFLDTMSIDTAPPMDWP